MDSEQSNIPKNESLDSENNKETQHDSLRIEIVKYKSFIDAITDPRRMARMVGLIALSAFVLFAGLLLITITLKRIYPYSDIQINANGATTIRDEQKDVIYWLFNPAELWAPSGIHVNKGDVLNIQASGMSHTAIHNLVRDAELNRALDTKWTGTLGSQISENQRNTLRSQWRIIPHIPQSALVMQVVGENFEENNLTASEPKNNKKNDIYLIGSGRNDLKINNDGYLYFTINDIVLTKDIIYKMTRDQAKNLIEHSKIMPMSEFYNKYPEEYSHDNYEKLIKDNKIAEAYDKYNRDKDFKESYQFGNYPAENDSIVNRWDRNEMTYYYNEKYYKAWFDDNIGSFLIVIERKHQ